MVFIIVLNNKTPPNSEFKFLLALQENIAINLQYKIVVLGIIALKI